MGEKTVFRRHEVKFRINRNQRSRIMMEIMPHMVMDDHGKNTILSLYYDTLGFRLIRRSMEHPEYKEKLRARSYGLAGSEDEVFLELKKKHDKVVYKRRMNIKAGELDTALESPAKGKSDYLRDLKGSYGEKQIACEIAYARDFYSNLKPRVLISYEREAMFDKDDSDFRITFDRNILWRDFDLDLSTGIYGRPILEEDEYLMEIKTANGIPIWLTDILSREHIYKTSFSKYGQAFEAIQKEEHIMNNIMPKQRISEQLASKQTVSKQMRRSA